MNFWGCLRLIANNSVMVVLHSALNKLATLLVGEISIPLHKVIIGARSQVFYKVLTSPMKESTSNVITFDPKYSLARIKVQIMLHFNP